MEIQIQQLIDSIKKDGLDQARKDADVCIANAKEEAARIVSSAKDEAEKLIQKAKKEIELEEKSSRASLEQAARDAVLSFKKGVEEELDRIIRTECADAASGKTLEKLITEVVSSSMVGRNATIEVKDAGCVSSEFVSKLASKIGKGLEVKASNQLSGGFRVVEKDGSGYIDLSDDEIAKLLKPYLSDSLKALV